MAALQKMRMALLRRDTMNNGNDGYDDDQWDHDDDYPWSYSDTAVTIKWAFIGAIVLLFLLWFIGGYYHAQRRIKNGQAPLRYHRFLLPRRQRMQYMPRPHYGGYAQQNGYGEGYPMHNYAPPPPAYTSEHIPPPVYQPSEGASKINPAQNWAVPPSGPPPAHMGAGESPSAMQSVPLDQDSNGQGQSAGQPAVPGKKPGMLARLNPFK